MNIATIPPGLVPQNLRGYYLALMKKGPRWTPGDEPPDLMKRHLGYLRQLIEQKQCVFAGPVIDDGPILGVCILTAASAPAAHELMAQDPSVLEGRTIPEIHPTLLPALDGVTVRF
jgi:uncharacterized protein YciI